MHLSVNDFKRFEKQIILKSVGFNGQKKIINSKVLIIGIGGLGCPLLSYLSASGVGTLGIVDHDKVEISNLNRQTLFSIHDLGKYKVDAPFAGKKLQHSPRNGFGMVMELLCGGREALKYYNQNSIHSHNYLKMSIFSLK